MATPQVPRRDRVRNRDAILAAAGTIFSAQGIDVPLDAIARAAGVGRATLYRNFEDRDALLTAMLESDLDALAGSAASAPVRDRFFHLLERVESHFAERASIYLALDHVLRAPERRAGIRARLAALFAAPIADAIAGSAVRADLQLGDLSAILRMVGNVALDGREVRPEAQRARLRSFLLDGLRPREPRS